MNNKSLIISISIILAGITLFLSGIWLAGDSARKAYDERIAELQQYDLRNDGVLMKYVYHASIGVDDYGLSERNYFSDSQQDNFVIIINCDGSVSGVHDASSENITMHGEPPIFSSKLTDEQMKKLRDGIEDSPAKKISYFWNPYSYNSQNYYDADYITNDTVLYIAEKNHTLRVGKNDSAQIIQNNPDSFNPDDSIEPLFDLVEDMLSTEIRNFSFAVKRYYNHVNENPYDGIYDFSTYGNNYNTNRYSNGVSMMRYYEKLCNTDDPADQRYCTIVNLESNGLVNCFGTLIETDKQGVQRFNEVKEKTKENISVEEIKILEQAVKDSDFLVYASEIKTGYEPDLSGVSGEYSTVKFFTVSVNHRTYSAIDDGTNPKLTSLIDKYLEVTTEGVKAEEAYKTSREEWHNQ